MDNFLKNNKVELTGTAVSGFNFSHELLGEKFYIVNLDVERLSGCIDTIKLMISGRIIDTKSQILGRGLHVCGSFRSYNKTEGDKKRIVLTVFVDTVEFLDDMQNDLAINEIILNGYICKEPTYRKTPRGREITDFLVAVNRSYGKSDYIPCICWGRNARFASGFEVGVHVQVCGRIQSREYVKKLSEIESEERTAYEVSVSSLDVLNESDLQERKWPG